MCFHFHHFSSGILLVCECWLGSEWLMVLVFFHFTFSTFTFFLFALRKFNYAILYALCFNLCNFCFKWSHFELLLWFRIQRVFKLSNSQIGEKKDEIYFIFRFTGHKQWWVMTVKEKLCVWRRKLKFKPNSNHFLFFSSPSRVFQIFS